MFERGQTGTSAKISIIDEARKRRAETRICSVLSSGSITRITNALRGVQFANSYNPSDCVTASGTLIVRQGLIIHPRYCHGEHHSTSILYTIGIHCIVLCQCVDGHFR